MLLRMRTKPDLRHSETYTESNFLRLFSVSAEWPANERLVTLEHYCYRPSSEPPSGWQCQTIIDREPMSKEDALFIARAFARENAIPVIYECHGD